METEQIFVGLEITNKDGFGIKVEGDSLINFSASHFSQNDLDSGPVKKNSQRHGKLLTPRKDVFLNIDGFIMGVGCIDSWKSLPRGRIPSSISKLSIWIYD